MSFLGLDKAGGSSRTANCFRAEEKTSAVSAAVCHARDVAVIANVCVDLRVGDHRDRKTSLHFSATLPLP